MERAWLGGYFLGVQELRVLALALSASDLLPDEEEDSGIVAASLTSPLALAGDDKREFLFERVEGAMALSSKSK